jgi:ubiquinol-cytochrome c reductase cytochrome b subunit
MALYPFIEQWVTGDKKEHHLLDRPRNNPNRTAIGAMALAFTLVALINGGNDLFATHFHSSINDIMWFSRIGLLVIPPITYSITKRICISLQRADREIVLHGRETGRLVMLPHGEFVEVHAPLDEYKKFTLTQHEQHTPLALPEVDDNGVRARGSLKNKLRKRISVAATEQIAVPTIEDLKAIENEHH